uniref:Uncharacterized protein n=1 Tax=Octopus bimaculoides TaxID=37653 RepID=A0A0L8G1Y2_OCTBM
MEDVVVHKYEAWHKKETRQEKQLQLKEILKNC